MKTFLFALTSLVAVALSPSAQSQTTYSVIKASLSLPGTYASPVNGGTITKNFTLTTKNVINLALGKDVNTPVPKDVLLGFAGVFSGFATHNPNNQTPMQLVVFQLPPKGSLTGVGTKLAPVAIGGDRIAVENVVINKYKRSATGFLGFVSNAANNPNLTGGFLPNINYPGDFNSYMLLTGTTTRTPNTAATPQTLKVKTTASAAGCVLFIYKFPNGDIQARQLIVSKGKFAAAGKILGTFDQ